jgi:hypothetical protein
LTAWRLVSGRPRQLYALTGSATARQLYGTNDGGDNWQLIGPAPGQTDRPPMVVLPGLNGAPDSITLVTGSRVQRSMDGGATWAPGGLWPSVQFASDRSGRSVQEAQNGLVSVLVGDGNAPNRLYALTSAGDLWQSDSAGLTWRVAQPMAGTGLAQPATALAIVPYFGVRVWVATTDGLAHTTDNGDKWEQGNLPPMPYGGGRGGSIATALAGDPRVPTTVYAALAWGAIYRSDDSGMSWISLGAPGSSGGETIGTVRVNALALDPDSRAALYAATDDGVWIRDVMPIQPTVVPIPTGQGSQASEETPTPLVIQGSDETIPSTAGPTSTSTQAPSSPTPLPPTETPTASATPTILPTASRTPSRTPVPATATPLATATTELYPTPTPVASQSDASDSRDLPPPPPATAAPRSLPTPEPR